MRKSILLLLLSKLAATLSFPKSFIGNLRREPSLDSRFRGNDNFGISKSIFRRKAPANLDTGVLLLLCILSVFFIFFSPESLAWWQKPKPEITSEQAEEKFAQTINQNLQEQVEELSAQVKVLEEKNRTLQTELNQISGDRQDLLKKLKDYSIHREGLETRILTLEKGIISLNEAKKNLSDTNKALAEQVAVLQKELKPVRAAEMKFKEELAEYKRDHKSSQEKRIDKLNAAIKKLKEDNGCLKRDLKKALSEVSSSNASLGRLKREVGFMHYNLGVIFNQAGNYNQALVEYQKVLEVVPDDAHAHYGLALIYDRYKRNKEKAIYHYKKYLEIEADAEDAAEVKGRITETELEQKIWNKK